MSKIVWDQVGEHFYETGVDRGVLYQYDKTNKTFGNGVAWNGLSAVNESPSGAEPTAIWADNIKYLNLMSNEEYAATIEAYTYPDEFEECDGSKTVAGGVTIGQQPRKLFGFSYRTLIGNDTEGTEAGYKIHLIYNCLASPSERSHSTVNDSPEAQSMSWSISTTPVNVEGMKPTSTIEIDSREIPSDKLAALEDILYGTVSAEPRLPLPGEIITLVGNASTITPAKLSALTLSDITLSPTFDANTTSYTATTSESSTTITATPEADGAAAIIVNGVSLTSGTSASLVAGANTITVLASKSGKKQTTYTVTVTKE